jgi:quinol-cytochrome oxidoreductase complex cytochrome b subunit
VNSIVKSEEGRKWQKQTAENPKEEEEESSNKDPTVLPSSRVRSKPSLLPVGTYLFSFFFVLLCFFFLFLPQFQNPRIQCNKSELKLYLSL